jgi:metal-sulfur cluster biosynthetic enzyme
MQKSIDMPPEHPTGTKQKIILTLVGVVVVALVIVSVNFTGLKKDYRWTRSDGAASTACVTSDSLLVLLRNVEDPELGLSIVDLGLIYEASVDKGHAEIRMGLTTPECPFAGAMIDSVRSTLFASSGIQSAHLQISLDPPWTTDRISPAGIEKLRSQMFHQH